MISQPLIARIRALRLRRAVAVVLASLVAFALTTSMASSQTKPAGPKPTVVLVHGAFADGSSWNSEIRKLQDDGYPVLALPIPVTDVMASAQRPLDAGVLAEPSHDPAWKTIPSWYLLPTEDRAIGTDAERAAAVRAGSQIVEVRASHAVLVSQPTKVTKLIEEAAQATATP